MAAGRSDIVGFRDGSPVHAHPESTPRPRPMSKTEAKRHLADAKRSIGKAQKMMVPTPQSVLEALQTAAFTEEQTKRVVAHHVREAEESLASLRRYLA